jgi:Pyridoxamine 5'-phosphate oxidase
MPRWLILSTWPARLRPREALRSADHQLALAYVRDDGSPSVSFRGSTYVRSSTELAIWAGNRDSGLAAAISDRPCVSLVFFGMDGPGARYLAIEGRARVAPDLDDEVYGAIIAPERRQDPERKRRSGARRCRQCRGRLREWFLSAVPRLIRWQSGSSEQPDHLSVESKRALALASSADLLHEP